MPYRTRRFRRPSLPLLGLALAFALPAIAVPAAAQRAKTVVDISRMPIDREPDGFTIRHTGGGAPAEWRVVEDSSATGKKSIVQTEEDINDGRYPLAIYDAVSAKNVEVSVRIKPVSGRVDRSGGIAIRLTTPGDYYVARANALENNVTLFRVVKGRRAQIKSAQTPVASGQWHTLTLRAEGTRFTVSFDGKEMFSAIDPNLAGPGKIALWTKADSVTHFDALSITPLD